MRTLFNVAHRLSNVLGPSWALVLETLNTLDRLLTSPSTTTQARPGWQSGGVAEWRGGGLAGVGVHSGAGWLAPPVASLWLLASLNCTSPARAPACLPARPPACLPACLPARPP